MFNRMPYSSILRMFSTSMASKRVGVILSGAGALDGSEPHELSSVLVNLSRRNAVLQCFAPDINQCHVMNHITQEVMDTKEPRNILLESGRIGIFRHEVKPLSDLNFNKFDALIFPGGLGNVKNLSTFIPDGTNMTVIPQVSELIHHFHAAGKPIGFVCIAPMIAARLIPGVSITLGQDSNVDGHWEHFEIVSAACQMGAKHVCKLSTEVEVDTVNKIVSTPAFLCNNAPIHEIFDGVGLLVENVLQLC